MKIHLNPRRLRRPLAKPLAKLLLGAAALALAGCDSLPRMSSISSIFGGDEKPARTRSSTHDSREARESRSTQHRDTVAALLAYDAELRRMSDGQISAEQNRASGDRSVYGQMRYGLALMRGDSASEVARAQTVFQSAAAHGDADTRGLAQLLAATCADLRRLYDQNDKLSVQMRETQRRNDQLSEMVDGLKNIERTLPTRSAPRAIRRSDSK